MADEKVTAGELERFAGILTDRMDTGFASVNARIERVEDRMDPIVMEHHQKIAILEDRALRAESAANNATTHVQRSKRRTTQSAAAWGSGAAGVVIFLLEMVKTGISYYRGH